MTKIAVLIPCYNEEKSIAFLCQIVANLMQDIKTI